MLVNEVNSIMDCIYEREEAVSLKRKFMGDDTDDTINAIWSDQISKEESLMIHTPRPEIPPVMEESLYIFYKLSSGKLQPVRLTPSRDYFESMARANKKFGHLSPEA